VSGRRRPLDQVVLSLLAAGLALASVGCGGSGGAPSGMTRFADRGLVLDYPSGWKKETAGIGTSGQLLNVRSPGDAHGLYVRATLFRQPREYSGIGQYGKDAARTRPFDLVDGRAVSDGPLSVPGASDGGWIVRTNYSYRQDGRKFPSRGVELLALTGNEQFRLTIAGPRDAVERSPEVTAMRKSLRVG